ncbi:PREDICTED: inducible T-cell costimulator [Condylura cristata]|uniref:inducible T-cell costimulator n=1 Tax=Condylura cristata TaxID=143302 RepID=UPI000642BDA2|nr:PREDICTED: inducible T-cell costimulator [Condylura cristata]
MFTIHNGGLQISCRYSGTVCQFKMQLLKGDQVLCELTKTDGRENAVSPKNVTLCKSQLSNNSVSFFLHNLDSTYASYYQCRLMIFDPPPFQMRNLSKEYLYIYESQFCCQLKFWLPIGCTGFILIYIFACVVICLLTKKKHRSSVHDPNSEYMFMAAMPTAKTPGGTEKVIPRVSMSPQIPPERCDP